MNFEPLLAWMAHVGGGSWSAFQRAVVYFAEFDSNGSDTGEVDVRRVRSVLSDLGCADFFVDGGSSWRAVAPIIGGIHHGEALVCGVRNRQLVDAIEQASERAGCERVVETERDAPPRIAVRGGEQALRAVAESVGLRFVPDLPRRLVAALVPVPLMIEAAEISDAPINWSHSAFDFDELSWSDQAASPTAHTYRSKYGAQQHFVDVPDRGLVALDRRTSVYAAAFVNSVDLVAYDESGARLTAPLGAPLPFAYARAATLCSGRRASVADGQVTYSAVPLGVAAALTVACGGSYPTSPRWFRRRLGVRR